MKYVKLTFASGLVSTSCLYGTDNQIRLYYENQWFDLGHPLIQKCTIVEILDE